MEVVALKNTAGHVTGALGQPFPLPPTRVLLFVGIHPNSIIHGRGLRETLRAYFLTNTLDLIDSLALNPNDAYVIPENTRHVLETSLIMPVLRDFKIFARYL